MIKQEVSLFLLPVTAEAEEELPFSEYQTKRNHTQVTQRQVNTHTQTEQPLLEIFHHYLSIRQQVVRSGFNARK